MQKTIVIEDVNFVGLPLEPYFDATHDLYAYYVGEDGRIWTAKEKRFLNPVMTPSGYYRVRLKYKSYKVHFLVSYAYYQCFRLNPHMDVHHIDGNRLNNAVWNLKPVSRDEHEIIHGRKIF